MNFSRSQGRPSQRVGWSFSFRRIVEEERTFMERGSQPTSDITDRVTLEREKRESEHRQQRQLELLMSVLHIEPNAQAEFIAAGGRAVARDERSVARRRDSRPRR